MVDLTGMLTVDDEDATRLVGRIHRRFADAGFEVPLRLWDGRRLGPRGAAFVLVLNHPWSLRAMLIPGTDLATGEAYLDDAFDVIGSMVEAIHMVAALREHSLALTRRLGLMVDVLRLPRPPSADERHRAALEGEVHSRERDAEAVRHHYDVSEDFYRLFLDANLVYSSGYFAAGDGSFDDPLPPREAAGDAPSGDAPTEVPAPPRGALDRAQIRKLDLVCRKLDLEGGERLLDVGCGWGSLLIHAATHYGVSGVGVTLSQDQASLARKRVAAAGLADRVGIRLQDYRDVTGPFDAIASLGMFEHVGADHHAEYFRTIHGLCRPGGRFLNQHITTGMRNVVRDMAEAEDNFLGAYVFPDGALVPAWMALRRMQDAGFEIQDLEQLRRHYACTLRHWVARLEANAEVARERAGQRAYRIWRAYMSASVVGFETRDLGVIQVLGTRGDAELPAGRAWMLPRRP